MKSQYEKMKKISINVAVSNINIPKESADVLLNSTKYKRKLWNKKKRKVPTGHKQKIL